MNAEITKLCGQIKERLEELQMPEFVLYASDYIGDLDEDVVEEKVAGDAAENLGFYFNETNDYSSISGTSAYIRKVKVKDGNVVFDIEEVYEDADGGWESRGDYEDQTIDDVLHTCSEEMVLNGLNAVLEYGLNEDSYYDIIGLNKLNQ